MQQNPYQYSSPLAMRKKVSLDIASPSPKNFTAPQVDRRVYYPSSQTLGAKKTLDGIEREKKPLLQTLYRRDIGITLFRIFRRAQLHLRRIKRTTNRLMPDLAPRKMLYGSLVGGVAFGMLSMAFIEHAFGPGVFARTPQVAGVETVASSQEGSDQEALSPYSGENDLFFEYFSDAAEDKYQENVRTMVKDYPIEEMLPYIFEQDRVVAAFLIGIAKKESNWGKRVPVLDGQDCFNYWGYRGQRRMMGSGGHTCFNSRKDAVETVAKRLDKLVNSEQLNTPEKLVVWKCGFSCAGHSRESVKKWISDVDMYYEQLKEE
ncbi:MAG: hypothetical protein AAB519_00285 [Patescibacteria group bacterium]